MATITLPSTPGFVTVTWGLVAPTDVLESPLTKSIQSIGRSMSRWFGVFELPPMLAAQAAAWTAALSSLEGMAGRMYVPVPNKSRIGTGTGTPTVLGGSQRGYTLATENWTPNETGALKAGDFIQLSTDQTVMVVVDADSDSDGKATFTVVPNLRSSPAHGSLLTIDSPKVTMLLVADDQAQWSIDGLMKYGVIFSAEEALT